MLATARGFQDGGVNVWVEQHVAGALRATAIASVDALALNVDAVGTGHADAPALLAENAGDQANRGGFSIGAGDSDQRNACVVALGEQAGNDGFTDSAALAEGGLQVHAQAGCGIDLDNAAALGFQRLQHVLADDVDPGNVQTDHLCGSNGARGEVGMDAVGDIGGRATG